MDISYLLWLQDVRVATQDVFTPLMQTLSSWGSHYFIFVPVFIYWCWDKRNGLLTLASLCVCTALTAVLKLVACVYRPWIKDPRIIPAVKELPRSYSFPSRHTVVGASIGLGTGLTFWQKKQTKVLAVLCVLLAVLIGFSRNYLGVHTPQDVVVGFLLSIGCVYAVWKTDRYLQKYPQKENRILLAVGIVGLLAFVYVLCKPYPMDYVNGKLLVSPRKMLNGAFEAFGALFAFCAARYVEKTWIRFQVTGLHLKGILAAGVGLVGLYGLVTYAQAPLKHLLGGHWGRFALSALVVLYIVALYPWVLKWIFAPRKTQP